jgi:hydroxyethylthiazole kinase-like uncharacterized protein yjeF
VTADMTMPVPRPLELLSAVEMAEADRLAAAAGIASLQLMERAGAAVAAEAAALAPPGGHVVILCGPGNNGGDGWVAARLLADGGRRVSTVSLLDPARLAGDAACMFARWSGPVHAPSEAPALLAGADVVIDALFGAGLGRPLTGEAAALVASLATSARPVVAVDVPSGLDGTTGLVAGGASGAVARATVTVTFFRLKPGHLLMPGRALCGRIVLADIGLPASVLERIDPATRTADPAGWWPHFPRLLPTAHKYTRGHAVVVSGPAESTGAARLGARGALRAGAGLVTLASPRAAFPVNAAQSTAIMVQPFTVPDGLTGVLVDARRNAVLLGPGAGLGETTRAMVAIALAGRAAVVLDADALTSFAGEVERLAASIAGRPADAGGVVLTPHDGELTRLFEAAGPGESKLERARGAARRAGAVVVSKGPDTVVAAPDGRASINDNAPPWLATAGSGDVLAGFVTGLVAQGMPAFEAATAAVWLHGEAARRFGPGLIAEDLPETLPAVLRALLASMPDGAA